MSQSAGPQTMKYAGQIRIYNPHKVCGTERTSPCCAGLMQVGPKRAGPHYHPPMLFTL